MRILVVAATAGEIGPLAERLRPVSSAHARLARYTTTAHEIDVLITGVGMVATASWASRQMSLAAYDLALNLGVCGSFNPAFAPGAVVHVVSDWFPELGAEDGEAFLTIQQMGLLGESEPPFVDGRLVNASPPERVARLTLPAANGITVNRVHGDDRSIALVRTRFNPDVESMEGAAFMYACLVHGVPFAQVRSVSNVVERRNRDAWKMGPAIEALNATAWRILES